MLTRSPDGLAMVMVAESVRTLKGFLVVGQLQIAGLFHNKPDAPARANRCRK